MLWIKGFHIIFMVTWFAGLFYLPRLFVYHAATGDCTLHEQFKVMEYKLFWFITTPGAIITITLGVWLACLYPSDILKTIDWLLLKFGLVLLLVAYHIWCGILLWRFKHGLNQYSHRWYRIFNEVPTLLLIAIVLLATLKPSF